MRALDRASAGDAISAFHLEAGIAACYQAALGLARSTPEQNWLASRLTKQ